MQWPVKMTAGPFSGAAERSSDSKTVNTNSQRVRQERTISDMLANTDTVKAIPFGFNGI